MSFSQIPCVVDKITFIFLDPRCVPLYMRGASLFLFINSCDDCYISRAMWELRPHNKKRAETSGQPATPLRAPLTESNEEQPEGNKADKKKKSFVKFEEEVVLLVV